MSEKKEKSKLSLSAKAKKFDVPLGTLKKVFRRGVAAWNSGHRPGTTPQQWGHARVNSYLRKGKTYHTADKDLHEDINKLFERLIFVPANEDEIAAADEIRQNATSDMSPDQIERKVWKETGVWVTPGGKSVTEIPDNEATYTPGSGNAKDLISHKKLTDRLPNIFNNVTANIDKPLSADDYNKKVNSPSGVEQGSYRPGQIGRNNTYTRPHITLSGTASSLANVGAHELQHMVGDVLRVPGFEGGVAASDSQEDFDAYWKNRGEELARLTGIRRPLDAQQRREIFPSDDLLKANDKKLAVQPEIDDTPHGGQVKLAPPPAKTTTTSPPPAKTTTTSPPTGSGSDVATEFRKRLEQQRQRQKINERLLREMQLVGTDEYRDYALAMTPGQEQEIQDAFPPETYGTEVYEPTTQEEPTNTESNGSVESGVDSTSGNSFRAIRKKLAEQEVEELEDEEQLEGEEEEEQTEDDGAEDGVDFTPNLKTTKARRYVPQVSAADSVSGFPVLGIAEAVEYHQENDISLLENIFRPGSDMFFAMILEAKRLYAEGEYTPQDDYEQDLLESDIGEVAEYNGAPVLLDFPYEEIDEELDEACWDGYEQKGMKKKGKKMVPNCVPVSEENDPTKGKGIGKPFRSRGGGAVYVRSAKGNVIKVNFSQSGMRKRFNEPARVKSFVARHNCYGNKDKTSASYWACRWPRYFSDTGQQWW